MLHPLIFCIFPIFIHLHNTIAAPPDPHPPKKNATPSPCQPPRPPTKFFWLPLCFLGLLSLKLFHLLLHRHWKRKERGACHEPWASDHVGRRSRQNGSPPWSSSRWSRTRKKLHGSNLHQIHQTTIRWCSWLYWKSGHNPIKFSSGLFTFPSNLLIFHRVCFTSIGFVSNE